MRQFESNIDHLWRAEEIRKILKERFKMNDYDIRDKIGMTAVPGSRSIRIHRKAGHITDDILSIPLKGEIGIIKNV